MRLPEAQDVLNISFVLGAVLALAGMVVVSPIILLTQNGGYTVWQACCQVLGFWGIIAFVFVGIPWLIAFIMENWPRRIIK